jgi:beta-lactamase class A
MNRRHFITTAGLLMGSSLSCGKVFAAAQRSGNRKLSPRLLEAFLSLPGNKSAKIDVDASPHPWRVAHEPDVPLFCGSCFKTFVLTTYLQEVEAGRLSESEQLKIDDDIRSVGGEVFELLTGTAPARTVLEAMIAHSDNTATDAAMLRVGVDKVRAFLSKAGLARARIPDSTRRFFSYVAGYPAGVDMGWAGLQAMKADKNGGPARPAINDQQTMVCPASDFVSYYKRALAGEFFRKQETLTEFKRIQAMADSIAIVVPADTPAYLKGGSISWDGFYCMATAGQMIVGPTPVTFCLNLNWHERDGSEATVVPAYKQAVADLLRQIRRQLLKAKG